MNFIFNFDESLEEWRDIVGYEGLYQISNFARARRIYKNGNVHYLTNQPKNGGYLKIDLCKDGVRKYFAVHRLVAEAFIPNPDNLPQVNHKDKNKHNNCAWNLEWCDAKYNANYEGTHKGSPSGRNGREIGKYDKETGELLQTYPSICDAKKELGVNVNNINLNMHLKGCSDSYHGFVYKYLS